MVIGLDAFMILVPDYFKAPLSLRHAWFVENCLLYNHVVNLKINLDQDQG